MVPSRTLKNCGSSSRLVRRRKRPKRVTRLSSRGLRALALGWQELAHGGVIAVCGLSPTVAEIFRITQYDRLFELHPDSTAAYYALSARTESAD